MKYTYLLFDLDGTISDPQEGIVLSLNYALSEHGFPTHDAHQLARYIGPPLDGTFETLSNSRDASLIQSLVAKYRERYSDVGYSENVLYDGIPEALAGLSAVSGIKLAVCTSKRVDFAERILERFELLHLFKFVSGGDIGIAKWQQLESLKSEGKINNRAVMIGDRDVDLTAAHRNGLDAAGVLWGFGDFKELNKESPRYMFSAPAELTMLAGE